MRAAVPGSGSHLTLRRQFRRPPDTVPDRRDDERVRFGRAAGCAVLVVAVLAALHPPHADSARTATPEPAEPATAVAQPTVLDAEPLDSTRAFFPLVRDGWRDTATFAWQVDPYYRTWTAVVRVSDADGVEVLRSRLADEPESYTWNGRGDGARVEPGRYRVRVALRLDTPNPLARRTVTERLSFPVRVATRSVDHTETVVIRPATHAGVAVNVRGNCFSRPERPGSLLLNCHPVGQLKAVLEVAVPEGATVESATHRGRILCCAPGNVRIGWRQPDADTLVLGIRVSGDRRYRLWSMLVTYAFDSRV